MEKIAPARGKADAAPGRVALSRDTEPARDDAGEDFKLVGAAVRRLIAKLAREN